MNTAPSLSIRSNQLSVLVLVVATRAILWLAWLLGLFLWVPRVESVFRLYNVQMPSAAQLVVALTHGLLPFGVVFVLGFILLDGSVMYRLRRAGTRAIWSSLMTLAPVAAVIFSAVALCLPMLMILEALSK
jgi:type II secretory pathway component PulF